MTAYREMLRLHSLGLNKSQIAAEQRHIETDDNKCAAKGDEFGLNSENSHCLSDKALYEKLSTSESAKAAYHILRAQVMQAFKI